MKEVLDKISSYNLFNYLFPGVLFAVAAKEFTRYTFFNDDIIANAFVAYFIGLVISRFGSLVLEPLLKWLTFVRFTSYTSYVAASEKDPKIELLSEANNTYRTLTALCILLLFLKVWEILEYQVSIFRLYGPYVLIVILLITFLFSYKKQTEYITKRVKASEK